MRTTLPSLILTLLLAGSAGARELQSVSKSYAARAANAVQIHFPAGDLFVTAIDGDRIEARMTSRCDEFDRGCAERAEHVKLVSDLRDKTMVFDLEGLSRMNDHGLSIGLHLGVPRSFAVTVDMGAGDLEIRGFEDDVEVQLGAGDAKLHLPEQAVRSVRLEVGVGDATLVRGHQRLDGDGFISKRLEWRKGPGSSRVRVHLGAGDADVTLD